MAKDDKTVKRTFRIAVKIEGATKEFQEGMGVGVIGYQDLKFDLPEKTYASPMFQASLEDHQKQIALSFIETIVTEIK